MTAKRDAKLEALAADFEIEIEFLELAVHEGAVREDELTREEPERSALALARLRRLQRLCASLDLDVYAGSIIVDLLERLERLQKTRNRGAVVERILEIGHACSKLPVLDRRSPEKMLYNNLGLPK